MTWKVKIPRDVQQVDRVFIPPLWAAAERASEIQAKAYRTFIKAKDAVASRRFLNSVRTRTVLRTESMLIKAAGSDLIQAAIMETGRRPGSMPPVSAILRWMPYRGIEPNRSHAFAIALSIARRGIKGRHIAEAAYKASIPDVIKEFQKAVAKAVKGR